MQARFSFYSEGNRLSHEIYLPLVHWGIILTVLPLNEGVFSPNCSPTYWVLCEYQSLTVDLSFWLKNSEILFWPDLLTYFHFITRGSFEGIYVCVTAHIPTHFIRNLDKGMKLIQNNINIQAYNMDPTVFMLDKVQASHGLFFHGAALSWCPLVLIFGLLLVSVYKQLWVT